MTPLRTCCQLQPIAVHDAPCGDGDYIPTKCMEKQVGHPTCGRSVVIRIYQLALAVEREVASNSIDSPLRGDK